MGILGTPPKATFTPSNKGLIAGLIKGNQWVFINPKNKGPRLFLLGGFRWFLWFLEVFMVNNLVFRWPKPLFFMFFWGAHGGL